jgi:hypothetical protein
MEPRATKTFPPILVVVPTASQMRDGSAVNLPTKLESPKTSSVYVRIENMKRRTRSLGSHTQALSDRVTVRSFVEGTIDPCFADPGGFVRCAPQDCLQKKNQNKPGEFLSRGKHVYKRDSEGICWRTRALCRQAADLRTRFRPVFLDLTRLVGHKICQKSLDTELEVFGILPMKSIKPSVWSYGLLGKWGPQTPLIPFITLEI